jgi:hypothetical protein
LKYETLALQIRTAHASVGDAVERRPGSDLNLAQNEQQPSFDSVIAVARANMQADKATIISAAMRFTDQEGAAFWPIYRQYERDRSTLDDGRVSVIKEYAEKYPKLTDAEAKDMAERMFEFDSRLAALKKTYYKKFNKILLLPGRMMAPVSSLSTILEPRSRDNRWKALDMLLADKFVPSTSMAACRQRENSLTSELVQALLIRKAKAVSSNQSILGT